MIVWFCIRIVMEYCVYHRSSILVDDATRNVLEVLKNYEESTDTTYESGDRRAIQQASHTLDTKHLAAGVYD